MEQLLGGKPQLPAQKCIKTFRTSRFRVPGRLPALAPLALVLLLLASLASPSLAQPVRFVGNQDYPPIAFSENGDAKGLSVDIINALSKSSGREVTIRLLEWDKAQLLVQHADADALGLLAITEERKAIFDFTDPVMNLEYSLFVRGDQSSIAGLEDLDGKNVGVIASGLPLQFLKQTRPGIRLVIVADYEDGLHQLAKGSIQAFAGDKWVALYHLQQGGFGNIRNLPAPFATRAAAFAVRKGNSQLLQELNRGLAHLKSQGVLSDIIEKWSGKQIVMMTREKLTRAIAVACSAVLLVLTLFLLFWIQTLRRQIAERRQADSSLRKSESRFRNMFDNAPVAVGIGEAGSGRLIEVNEAWRTLLGYELHEVIGRTTAELELYEDTKEREDIIRAIGEHGRVVNRSIRLRHKKGQILDILYFGEIFTLDSQQYLQVMLADITEHMHAEELLNKGRIEMYNLFNNSEVAMFRSRLDGSEIVNANQKFLDIVAMTRAEVVGRPALPYWAAQGQRAEILHRLRTEGRVVDYEIELLDKRGNIRNCLTSLTLTADDEMLDGSVIDITERKRAEESLLRSEARYRDFVEGTSDLVTQVDPLGIFLFVNSNAERYFGCPAAECVGLTAFDFVHPDDREKTLAAFQAWVGSGARSATFENRQVSRTGEIHDMLWTINLSYDGEGLKQINSIARDVTEQRKLQNEMIKSQKLESLGVLAGGIAHDFNNILTGIVGSISLARLSLETSHRATGLLGQAEDACQRAGDLARQLLTFAKGNSPIKKLVSAGDILESSASLVLRGSNTQSVFHIAADLKDLEVDEGQMSQAFNNLIINAAQAMPEGGVVTISAQNALPEEQAERHLPPGAYVKLSFTDTGCGISEENQQRIFDPYFTTKSSGSGLGLASVHSIISKHRGHIGVSSREGAGTTFVVLLPASSRKVPARDLQLPTLSERKHEHGPVLVMDDEEVIRVLAAEMLRRLGYEVQTCSSGEQAVTIYHAALTADMPFAAVIMDLTIPGGMGGKEAARRILELDRSAFLIVSSGYSNDPIMAEYAKYGFSAMLAKPYNVIELEEVLSTLCQDAGEPGLPAEAIGARPKR
jgi:two-component system, cell cycle sensor histidine kinase and response regulator CckA